MQIICGHILYVWLTLHAVVCVCFQCLYDLFGPDPIPRSVKCECVRPPPPSGSPRPRTVSDPMVHSSTVIAALWFPSPRPPLCVSLHVYINMYVVNVIYIYAIYISICYIYAIYIYIYLYIYLYISIYIDIYRCYISNVFDHFILDYFFAAGNV